MVARRDDAQGIASQSGRSRQNARRSAHGKTHDGAEDWKTSPAILFCFTCLYLATSGPGPIGVDAMRKK